MSIKELERRARLRVVGLPMDTPCPECREVWWYCICARFPATGHAMEEALRTLAPSPCVTRVRFTQRPVAGWPTQAPVTGVVEHAIGVDGAATPRSRRSAWLPLQDGRWVQREVTAKLWSDDGTPSAELIYGVLPWLGQPSGSEPATTLSTVLRSLVEIGLPWPLLRHLDVRAENGEVGLRAMVTQNVSVLGIPTPDALAAQLGAAF
ncbi:MAG: hypothetical protein EKK55_12400, partial [Rhodocyclaceae bacterium]